MDYAWPECPYCCAQPEDISNLRGTHAWQRTRCLKCDQPFELRLTMQARFEVRQPAEEPAS